jgi:predicted transcriptional regulator
MEFEWIKKIAKWEVFAFKVSVHIADNRQAAVMFPDRHGEINMSTLFVSYDPKFCDWCSDLFEYYWHQSMPFSLKETKVVE